MKRVWVFIWVPVSVLLLSLSTEYAVLGSIQAGNLYPVAKLTFIFALLFLLFVVEGVEIAVAGLLDKDPEQIEDDPPTRSLLKRLQADPERFLIGRQFLAVTSIVILTFVCGSLASLPERDENWLLSFTTSGSVKASFRFAFPILVVFWYAQLLPKFFAHENPLRFLAWPIVRWVVTASILMDRVEAGSPSRLIKVWLEAHSTTPRVRKDLPPSRGAHYRTSATLHGRGLKRADIQVAIGPEGQVAVMCEYCFEGFGSGFDSIPETQGWEAPIDQKSCKVSITTLPASCGEATITGPIFAAADLKRVAGVGTSPVEGGELKWEIEFQRPVPVGEQFKYKVQYSAGARACEYIPGKSDYYVYRVKVPTELARVTIIPAENANFALTTGECSATVGDETNPASKTNLQEAKRVEITGHKRGYLFVAQNPLQGTMLILHWKIGQPLASRTEGVPLALSQ